MKRKQPARRIISCRHCKKLFSTRSGKALFCSAKCRFQAWDKANPRRAIA